MKIEYDSSKESVTLVDTYVAPPPPNPWPRTAPDLLDLDFVDLKTIQAAKFLDGSPGYDGKGTAIHYGDMTGAWGPAGMGDYSNKIAGSGFSASWGVEANGLHYLETGALLQPRAIDWWVRRFDLAEAYSRFMVYVFPETLPNTTELGIKLSGFANDPGVSAGTFAEIFELGNITPIPPGMRTSFPLQAYRYDAEGAQGVTVFPNITILPGRWYTLEEHVKVPSSATAADGVMEFKVDGVMQFARSDVKMGAVRLTRFQVQLYHGGVKNPSGPIHFKIARVALSRGGWVGPAPELQP